MYIYIYFYTPFGGAFFFFFFFYHVRIEDQTLFFNFSKSSVCLRDLHEVYKCNTASQRKSLNWLVTGTNQPPSHMVLVVYQVPGGHPNGFFKQTAKDRILLPESSTASFPLKIGAGPQEEASFFRGELLNFGGLLV